MGARDRIKAERALRPKRERFIRMKMWISYLTSMITRDRGKIPDNIGNNILITNNLYITKPYMSAMIQICSLSLETPICWQEDIVHELRKEKSEAIVDFIEKNQNFDVKLKDSGLESRIHLWERCMDDDMISDREKERAARCLYTVDVAREGNRLFKTRMFVVLRAKTGSAMARAEKVIYRYLTAIGAEYLPISANIKEMLQYTSLIADYRDKSFKDVQALVNSETTMAQMSPNTNGFNGTKGLYMGIDILNNAHFILDLEHITVARNIYVVAPSGVGKTVLAMNACCSALENGWAVCVMDIKGNEFTNFTKAGGGYVVSLRATSNEYINSYKLIKDDCDDDGAEMYYKSRVGFSKKQLTILSGIVEDRLVNELSELLDEFFDTLYVSLGILSTNRNTWSSTAELSPQVVYNRLMDYLQPAVQKKYHGVVRDLINSLKMYMSQNGSMSYVFRTEFDYSSMLKAPILMFDFGILEGSQSSVDVNLFRLKFLYMQKLNSEFITYKHAKGQKVLKVLEESQVVSADIMKSYVEEYTLRRAQGQSTLLLGNSVQALVDNTLSKPLIENTRALFIGKLPKEARETVIRQFDLEEKRSVLEMIGETEEFTNSFIFINNMQPEPLCPVIKVMLKKGERYSLNEPAKQKNASAGG